MAPRRKKNFGPPRDSVPEWYWELALNGDGIPKGTISNAVQILALDDAYGTALAYNELSGLVELAGVELTDEGVTAIRVDIERRYFGCSPSRDVVYDAVGSIADRNRFHPVRQFLEKLEWDGEPRLQRVLTEILGLPFSQLHETYILKWFVGAVARVFEPGCKLDTQLILIGAQGAGKSTFFSVLGGKYFSDTPMVIGSKDAFLQLRAGWIHEVAELQSYRRREHEDIKAFLSSSSDHYRTPFGRTVRKYRRTCVLVGSSNVVEIIRDPTGSRRYWIIQLRGPVQIDTLKAWREQLWAEAVQLYRDGMRWHLEANEDAERDLLARDFEEADPWDEPVIEWSRAKAPFTSAEVLEHALGIKPAEHRKCDEMRVSDILRRHGAVKEQNAHKVRGARVRRWLWPNPAQNEAEHEEPPTQPSE